MTEESSFPWSTVWPTVSSVEAFADHPVCMRRVDVVLVTGKFEGFANSMNRISTNHLLVYVKGNFNCTEFEDRKLCVRR